MALKILRRRYDTSTLRSKASMLRCDVTSKQNTQKRPQMSSLMCLWTRISLQNGVNFREFKGFIQIEQGENIDNQLTIGFDQSI